MSDSDDQMRRRFLAKSGIWANTPPGEGEFFIEVLADGQTVFAGDEVLYEIESECQAIHDILQRRIFTQDDPYFEGLGRLPIWVLEGGNDSDFAMARQELEGLLTPPCSQEPACKIFRCHARGRNCSATCTMRTVARW